MRKQKDITPNRYKALDTSGSNKFVSTFSQRKSREGIVEKRDRQYNWINYKYAVVFTLVIGALTYYLLEKLM
ncbi:MAG: hypothetical protein AAGA77_07345 [Bacteroidota bacterium]